METAAANNPRRKSLLRDLWGKRAFFALMAPGIVILLVNSYLPIFGIVVAFKEFDYERGIFGSPWSGLRNFEFIFATGNIWNPILNTLYYNAVFIVTVTAAALALAVMLSELRNRRGARAYQYVIIMPSFLSIIIIASIANAFLANQSGFVNSTLAAAGLARVDWYGEPGRWRAILPVVNLWKSAGIISVLYYASICGIDQELYEAAQIDGASKLQQVWRITLPMIRPVIAIQIILAVGNMMKTDIGMFQQVTMDQALLYPATDVVDTFVYRSLIKLRDVGMSSAAAFFQSAVGCLLLLAANFAVGKVDPDSALF